MQWWCWCKQDQKTNNHAAGAAGNLVNFRRLKKKIMIKKITNRGFNVNVDNVSLQQYIVYSFCLPTKIPMIIIRKYFVQVS